MVLHVTHAAKSERTLTRLLTSNALTFKVVAIIGILKTLAKNGGISNSDW
jgi:multisubunit Na+/H+ antiporter MnhF subunit